MTEIDLSQFHAAFLDEASEHCEALEQELIGLENSEEQDMDALFRAAHSIKGGAATFGFDQMANFTHNVESLLDEARQDNLELTKTVITELLKASDIINEMVMAAKEDREPDIADMERCEKALSAILAAHTGGSSVIADEQEEEASNESGADSAERFVKITFKPSPELPETGAEIQNLIRELADFGNLEVTVHTNNLPDLWDLHPDQMYLWWEFLLDTTASDTELENVFIFVEFDAEINVEAFGQIGFGDFDDDPPAATNDDTKVASKASDVTPFEERRDTGKDRRTTKDRRTKKPAAETTIRVAVDKVDNLINLVGELVTANAMVNQCTTELDLEENQALEGSLTQINSHTRNLQEAIMSMRMMPIDFAFNRFPRMVRDISDKLGKKIHLEISGGHTELDKTIIEKIIDPLTHLVRNAVDHGIEMPAARIEAGKQEEGIVMISAYYMGGNVVIEIRDDGHGLNRDKLTAKAIEKGIIDETEAASMSDNDVWNLIFHAGFSTAETVTDVSGRGVGMDVVKKNIKGLGGTVNIESILGEGSLVRINLPLTLAIIDGMAMKVRGDIYIVPVLSIVESIRVTEDDVETMQKGVEVINVRGEYLPLLRLSEVFKTDEPDYIKSLGDGIVIITESDQGKIAMFVDDLLGEMQVVIKSLKKNYKSVDGLSGATILGDGHVGFILDLPGLIALARKEGSYNHDMITKKSAQTIEPTITQDTKKVGSTNQATQGE